MRFFFYSPIHFERWDWRNLESGIGNSETAHIELCWRLAARGHEVISYAPTPDDCPGLDRGVTWKRYEEADFTQDGIWVIYRDPTVMDKFGPRRPTQPRWLISQDITYQTWTKERAEQCDRIVALSPEHAKLMLGAMPYVGELLFHLPSGEARNRLSLSRNGVRCDLIRRVEAQGLPPRNPKKIVFASSPDRGLLRLLKIFSRAREFVPDLELHAFYGFNNIDKLKWPWLAKQKKQIRAMLKGAKGVHWRGRISQEDLYREYLTAGLWVYPTTFFETSCATAMEAQALGAMPIVSTVGALVDHVRHGVWITGNADDPLTQARFAGEIIRFARQPDLPERIRARMMPWARSYFNWSVVVDQYESWAGEFPEGTQYQFAFQVKHATGRILNVGCAGLSNEGRWKGDVVNVDGVAVDPGTLEPTRAHAIMDIREPVPACLGTFDTVVLGDILEHFTRPSDIVRALGYARNVLRPGGRVVVTLPNDVRSQIAAGQPWSGALQKAGQYLDAVVPYHFRAVSREQLVEWVTQAGLVPTWIEALDYTHVDGHGIVAMVP